MCSLSAVAEYTRYYSCGLKRDTSQQLWKRVRVAERNLHVCLGRVSMMKVISCQLTMHSLEYVFST